MRSTLLIGVFLLIFSCSPTVELKYAQPSFPIIEEIKNQRLSDNLMIRLAIDLFVDEEYIYVLALSDKKWLQIYDKNSGKYVGSAIHRGRGKGEINMPYSMNYDEKTKKLQIYDGVTSKLFYYQLTNKANGFLTYIKSESFLEEGTIWNMWHLSNERYLINGQKIESGVKRFQLLDSDKETAFYNNFPIEKEVDKIAFISNTRTTISSDKSKMATTTLFGGVLEIFDISNGIKRNVIRNFYPPEMKFNRSGKRVSSNETTFGFISIKATNKLIYTASCFKNHTLSSRFDKISIFDWNGEEVAQYHSDCQIDRLYIRNDEPNRVYAVACTENTELYLTSFTIKL